jgi:AraC-like DNA-binding protein
VFASRPPCPALRHCVRLLWAGPTAAAIEPHCEHVLPTGTMHLALRLQGPALRLFVGPHATRGLALGHAVVGGVRTTYYAREAGVPGYSVGAQLDPGASRALFGAHAEELAGRHTPLSDLWGPAAGLLIEQLNESRSASHQLALLEKVLLARLRGEVAMHAGVVHALAALGAGWKVADAVRASGLSHRHLVQRFRETTGLAPKEHALNLRLQHALAGLQAGRDIAEVAVDAGYADQAHLTRDFRVFAGMTPGQWRRARRPHSHHVPAPTPL